MPLGTCCKSRHGFAVCHQRAVRTAVLGLRKKQDCTSPLAALGASAHCRIECDDAWAKSIALQFRDELDSQLPIAAFLTAADGCVVEHQGLLNPRCLARIKHLQSQCPAS